MVINKDVGWFLVPVSFIDLPVLGGQWSPFCLFAQLPQFWIPSVSSKVTIRWPLWSKVLWLDAPFCAVESKAMQLHVLSCSAENL